MKRMAEIFSAIFYGPYNTPKQNKAFGYMDEYRYLYSLQYEYPLL